MRVSVVEVADQLVEFNERLLLFYTLGIRDSSNDPRSAKPFDGRCRGIGDNIDNMAGWSNVFKRENPRVYLYNLG